MTTTILSEITFARLDSGKLPVTLETSLAVATDDMIETFEKDRKFGIFRILNQKDGDKRLVWNRLSLADMNEASRMFDQFTAEGLQGYRVGGDGRQGERMEKFDPTAEEVIFLPIKLVAGG